MSAHKSNIVGTSFGNAAFSCGLEIRPTICPKASTEDRRTCAQKQLTLEIQNWCYSLEIFVFAGMDWACTKVPCKKHKRPSWLQTARSASGNTLFGSICINSIKWLRFGCNCWTIDFRTSPNLVQFIAHIRLDNAFSRNSRTYISCASTIRNLSSTIKISCERLNV